jgi:hypothetical protein
VGEIQTCQVEIVQGGGGERTVRRGGRGRGSRKVAGMHEQGSRNWGAKVRSHVHGNYATGVTREERRALATHFEF